MVLRLIRQKDMNMKRWCFRMLSYDVDVINKSIKKHGINEQFNVAIEEMSELTKELCKNMRGCENTDNIIEELADVYIMLENIKIIYQIQDKEIQREINYKLNRLEERMKNE